MYCYVIFLTFFATYPVDTAPNTDQTICSDDCDEQWSCQNKTYIHCIPLDGVCDGVIDCLDGSDELHAFCRQRKCPPYLFRCTYGACVDGDAKCNGVKECADGSDEIQCENQEREVNGTFICNDGSTIPSDAHCDGVTHCSDGSDETLASCAGRHCAANLFQCAYGACVDEDAPCDAYGYHHCTDGSDEAHELCSIDANRPFKNCLLPDTPDENDSHLQYEYGNHRERNLYVDCHYPDSTELASVIHAHCVGGYWDIPMKKCPKYCKVPSNNNTRYVCGIDGQLCTVYVQSGTTVNPQCHEGYHQQVPRYMTCRDGEWDHKVTCERATPKCGTSTSVQAMMINGVPAKLYEMPWHAGIYEKKDEPVQICGGSLVSLRVVVSAAHCFWDDVLKQLPPANYSVALGQLGRRWSGSGQKFNVSSIKLPATFDGANGNYEADIALVILDKPVVYTNNVRPVCFDVDDRDFNERQLAEGRIGKVAGWGLTSEDGNPSDELIVNEIPVVSNSKCKQESPFDFRRYITPDKFCAGNMTGNALCRGDSGGGLVIREGESQPYYLRGIVSTRHFNEHNCNIVGYTTFTRVFHYFDFIKANIQ